MEEAAKYLMVAAGAISLFTFLTVSHWVSTRSAERRDRDRLALLRKMAELPAPAAESMRQLLREEDARHRTRVLQKAARERYEGLQSGAVLIAVGVGISIFLYMITPQEGVWGVGIMVGLIGVAIAGFAYFRPVDAAHGGDPHGGPDRT